MQSKKLFYWALMLMTTPFLLAGCGGGGGGGGAAEPVRAFSIAITAGQNNLSSNNGEVTFAAGTDFASSLSVRVTRADGSPAPDGLVVGLSVSNAALGTLSTTDDDTLQTASLSLLTVAGTVSAVFRTLGQTGEVQVTAAAFDAAANRNVSRFTTFSISQGPDFTRIPLEMETIRTTIPANQFGVAPFIGSPFSTEVTITYRNADGTVGTPLGGTVGVSVDPVTLGAFTTLDDPSTVIDESAILIGNGPVDLAAGKGTIFVHSFGSAGNITVSITAQDAEDGEEFALTLDLEIIEPASDGRPANIQFLKSAEPQYIQGAGGNISSSFQIILTDGAGELVDDPSGNNNLFLEVFDDTDGAETGALLSATAVNGNQVQGQSIAVATTAGVAGATLTSGTVAGIVRLRATADLIDNIIGNGIQGPVSSEISVIISDGVPFSITLSQIPVNSLIVNPIASPIVPDATPTDGIPPEPNATYSLNVGAIVTDRFGNPPAQAVQLQFGLIDSPLDGYPSLGSGVFSMSGADGDPDEGGIGFFAPGGEFRTGGGGAGPNDTLILFGKDVVGNDDHESARTVSRVIDQADLVVDEPFNLNDFTGRSVDNGPVLPYIVGRALVGNIESPATTDSNGVGNTRMNYPVSSIGRTTAIYVQTSSGGLAAFGDIKTIADAAIIRYPGLSPLRITASPTIIQSNTTVNVLVCVEDAANVPIVGQFILFAFTGSDAIGSVDGVPSSGITASPTGFDGCTIASVTTSGVQLNGGDDFMVTFSVGDMNAAVAIAAPATAILQAVPGSLVGSGVRTITLTYLSGTGSPVADIALTGGCVVDSGPGTINIITPPGVTDANGMTTTRVQVVNFNTCVMVGQTPPTEANAGVCTFSAASGEPSVEVAVTGIISGDGVMFSPGCTP